MSVLLELRDVAQRFGETRVFEHLLLTVETGRHLALIGPSGGGKSTLLRLISGLDAPAAGEILIDGRTVARAGAILVPPHERRLSMVFQDLALWPNLTALQNVELGLSGLRLTSRENAARARAALNSCGIEQLADRRPAALSIGQQQRVALARAFAVQPKLLLLDEPFSSLDPLLKTQLYEYLRRLIAEFAITMILVTHDLLEAQALALDVAVIENGGISERGDLVKSLHRPVSETLRALAARIVAPDFPNG